MADQSDPPPARRGRRLFRRTAQEEVSAELDFHVAMRAHDLAGSGIAPEDADQRARSAFAAREAIAAECVSIATHTQRRVSQRERIAAVAMDVRFAIRQLSKAPAFTLGVIATLALGIGVSSSVFALLDGIFWRYPAGVAAPALLRRAWIADVHGPGATPDAGLELDYPRYDAIRSAVFPAPTALYSVDASATLRQGTSLFPAHLAHATSSFFPLLGARPLLGRFYSADEDRLGAAAAVMVVSEQFWRRSLGGDPGVIGKPIHVGSSSFTVIGIAAAPFTGVDLEAVDAWVPLGGYPGQSMGGTAWWQSRNWSGFEMVYRPLSDHDAAARDARATLAVHQADSRSSSVDSTVHVVSGSIIVARGPGQASAETAIALRLGGVALMLLLIVTANVLGLMLARGMRRRQEIAMRLALGISRSRLLGLLLAESSVLAVVASIASIAAAVAGGALLRAWLFPDTRWAVAPMHWHVLLFAGGAAAAIALLAALVSLTQSTGRGAELIGRVHGRTSASPGRLRTLTVVGQVTLSTVLLVGAALFVQSLRNVQQLETGYDADRLVYTVARDMRGGDRAATQRQVVATVSDIAARTGADAVAMTSAIPLQIGGFGLPWYVGTDSMGARAHFRPTVARVTPGYFAAVSLRFVSGTDFGSQANGIVVNQEMANTIWSGVNPIGACIHLGSRNQPCHLVTGVVRTAHRSALIERPLPQYFISTADSLNSGAPDADIMLLRLPAARTAAAALQLATELRRALPDARVSAIRLHDTLETAYHPWRLGAALFALFGVLALLVASIGVYSAVAYDVAQRTRDFGIRAALGASLMRLGSGVVRGALMPVAAGVIMGVVLALAATKVVASLLYEVSPHSPGAFALAAVVPLVAAIVSALLPAWRAARVDPAIALRSE